MPIVTTDTEITSNTPAENLTVLDGAVATIRRPLNRWGTVEVRNGRLVVDATALRQLTLSTVVGLTVGQTLTASGGASGEVCSISGSVVQVVSLVGGGGAIATGETVTAGSFNATVTTGSSTGHMPFKLRDGFTISTASLGSIEFRGAYTEVGISTGAANQSFTLPTLSPGHWFAGIEVETAANSGNYELWRNISAIALTNIGAGLYGNWYRQEPGIATATLGNGTNGNIPPAGARLRVQSLTVLSVSNTTDAPIFSNVSARGRFNTAAGGAIDCSNTSFGGFFLDLRGCDRLTLQRCSFSAARFVACPEVRIEDSICCSDQSANASGGLIGSDSSTITLRRCAIGGNFYQNVLQLSASSVVVDACRIDRPARTSTNTHLFFAGCIFTIENLDIVGTGLQVQAGRGTIRSLRYSDQTTGVASTTQALTLLLFSFAERIEVFGCSLLPSSPPLCFRNHFAQISAVAELLLDGVGTFAAPFDFQGVGGRLVSIVEPNQNLTIRNAFVVNSTTTEWINTGGVPTMITNFRVFSVHVGGAYATAIKTNQIAGAILLGFFASTIPTSFQVASNFVWYSVFSSATTAIAGIFFNRANASDGYANTGSGSANQFNGSGGLALSTTGAQATYTSPTQPFLGFSGFTGVTLDGFNVSNFDIEYRLIKDPATQFDFTGAWQPIANLSSESGILPSGWRIQIRLTAIATSSNNILTRLSLNGTTTAALQQAVDYPITRQVPLQVLGLVPGARVLVFHRTTLAPILSANANSQGNVQGSYAFPSGASSIPVRVNARLAGYLPYSIDAEITSAGLLVYATLPPDLVYTP